MRVKSKKISTTLVGEVLPPVKDDFSDAVKKLKEIVKKDVKIIPTIDGTCEEVVIHNV
jgi:hypothetical protein